MLPSACALDGCSSTNAPSKCFLCERQFCEKHAFAPKSDPRPIDKKLYSCRECALKAEKDHVFEGVTQIARIAKGIGVMYVALNFIGGQVYTFRADSPESGERVPTDAECVTAG